MPGNANRRREGTGTARASGESAPKRPRSGDTNDSGRGGGARAGGGGTNGSGRGAGRAGGGGQASTAAPSAASRSPQPDPRTPPTGRLQSGGRNTSAVGDPPTAPAPQRRTSARAVVVVSTARSAAQSPRDGNETSSESAANVDSLEGSSESDASNPDELETPLARRRSSTARASHHGNSRGLSGDDLRMATQNVSDMPVHLRIALLSTNRVNAKSKFPEDKGLYLGYPIDDTSSSDDEGEDEGEEPSNTGDGSEVPEVGVSCPKGAKVPVYHGANRRKKVLNGGCSDDQFYEAITGLLPPNFELYPDSKIRVPIAQWTVYSSRKYWDTTKRSKSSEDYIHIEPLPDAFNFKDAIEKRGSFEFVKESTRAQLDAYACDEEVGEAYHDPLEDDESKLEEVNEPYAILEVLVVVRPRVHKPCLQTNLTVEIAAPVEKLPNGTYQVGSKLPCKGQTKLVLLLGEEKNEQTRLRYGPIRDAVQRYCRTEIHQYGDKVHKNSRLYVVPNRGVLQCERIESSADFYDYVFPLKIRSTDKASNTVEKIIRVGLTRTENDEQPVYSPVPEGEFENSQPVDDVWHYPQEKVTMKGRDQRAARTVNSRPRELVKELYSNPDSPLHHGFTLQMQAVLEKLFQNPEDLVLYKFKPDSDEPYPMEQLVSLFKDRLYCHKVNNLIPEKGKYLPDASGNPPSCEPPSKLDELNEQRAAMNSALVEVAGAMRERADNRSVSVMQGVSFRRVKVDANGKLNLDEDTYDVSFSVFKAVQTKRGAFKDDPDQELPFGKRLYMYGQSVAPQAFRLDDTERRDLNSNRAQMQFIVDPEASTATRRGRACVIREDLYKWPLASFTMYNTEQRHYDYLPLGILVHYPPPEVIAAVAATANEPEPDPATFDFDRF